MAKEKIVVRGASFEGVVTSTKPKKTAIITIQYYRKVPKYDRFEKRRTKIHAHIPDGLAVKDGDHVRIRECRKISKTKAHIVTEVLSN